MLKKNDINAQLEALSSQVATLQTLVNTLQNQQSNPATSIPQVTGSSKATTIPVVSQVTILSSNPGAAGFTITVGFQTPNGILANQIDHYNIWLQSGASTASTKLPQTIVASTKNSPCTFTVSSLTSSTTGVVGVQTVMKDGQVLAFNLCPTTALTLTLSSNLLNSQATGSVALTASTPTNIGSSITVGTAGTYLVWLNIQVASAATAAVNFTMNKNGSLVGSTFTQSVANNNEDILNVYSLALAAGDVLQAVANVTVTGNYFFTIQFILEKQFVS